MDFIYDEQKNQKLYEERGITFEDVIEAFLDDRILYDASHPNKEKYPNQRLMIVDINNYPYAVPYLKNEDGFVLKTIYPDRRYKKLLEKNNEK
jgi:hypothetical protein